MSTHIYPNLFFSILDYHCLTPPYRSSRRDKSKKNRTDTSKILKSIPSPVNTPKSYRKYLLPVSWMVVCSIQSLKEIPVENMSFYRPPISLLMSKIPTETSSPLSKIKDTGWYPFSLRPKTLNEVSSFSLLCLLSSYSLC